MAMLLSGSLIESLNYEGCNGFLVRKASNMKVVAAFLVRKASNMKIVTAFLVRKASNRKVVTDFLYGARNGFRNAGGAPGGDAPPQSLNREGCYGVLCGTLQM